MIVNRTIQTSVSLQVKDYVLIRELAERERRSMSSVVRDLIERGLERERDCEQQREEIEQ